VGERAAIVVAGPLVNTLLGFLLFTWIFLWGAPTLSTKVGTVLEGYPAMEAGLKAGDRIVAVNGKKVEGWEEVTRAIHAQTTSFDLTVEREGVSFTKALHPRIEEVTNLLGSRVRMGMVGITPSEEVQIRRYPPIQAVLKAAHQVFSLTHLTLRSLWRMVTGGLSIRESVTGPIGIFYITSSVAEQGFMSVLQLVGILSTSLGIFNLLPIPILDGGHLGFLLLEKARRRPVSPRFQEVMTRVGLGFLALLLVVVTYNDLVKFRVADRFFSLRLKE
jgi:regulator of sigma E protease